MSDSEHSDRILEKEAAITSAPTPEYLRLRERPSQAMVEGRNGHAFTSEVDLDLKTTTSSQRSNQQRIEILWTTTAGKSALMLRKACPLPRTLSDAESILVFLNTLGTLLSQSLNSHEHAKMGVRLT